MQPPAASSALLAATLKDELKEQKIDFQAQLQQAKRFGQYKMQATMLQKALSDRAARAKKEQEANKKEEARG